MWYYRPNGKLALLYSPAAGAYRSARPLLIRRLQRPSQRTARAFYWADIQYANGVTLRELGNTERRKIEDFALTLPLVLSWSTREERPSLRRIVPAVPSGYIRKLMVLIVEEFRLAVPCGASHWKADAAGSALDVSHTLESKGALVRLPSAALSQHSVRRSTTQC